MFNHSNTQPEWSQKAEYAVQEIATQVKSTAGELLDTVNEQTDSAQDKAHKLIQKLKLSVDALMDNHDAGASELDQYQLAEKAGQFKRKLQHDMSARWKLAKKSGRTTVKEHPVGTVVVAASAGLLIGYLVSKYSDR